MGYLMGEEGSEFARVAQRLEEDGLGLEARLVEPEAVGHIRLEFRRNRGVDPRVMFARGAAPPAIAGEALEG